MRYPCKDCACKHLSQAMHLHLRMVKEDRPYLIWMIIGSMAEAAEELVGEPLWRDAARAVRAARVALPQKAPGFLELIEMVAALPEATKGEHIPDEANALRAARNPRHKACEELAQASILISESLMGYPEHRLLAIAHLARAGVALKDEGDNKALLVKTRIKAHLKQLRAGGEPLSGLMYLIALLAH